MKDCTEVSSENALSGGIDKQRPADKMVCPALLGRPRSFPEIKFSLARYNSSDQVPHLETR